MPFNLIRVQAAFHFFSATSDAARISSGGAMVVSAEYDPLLRNTTQITERNRAAFLMRVDAIVALLLNPAVLAVGDIMGPELETVHEDQGIRETIQQMRAAGVAGFRW